jgi:hypothetical protein
MKNRELINKLCEQFETKLDGDEAAAEMMRVIKAVSEERLCVLLSEGLVAPVLKTTFDPKSNIWKYVELQAV